MTRPQLTQLSRVEPPRLQRAPRLPEAWRRALRVVLATAAIVAGGIYAGTQFVNPNSRVITAAVGLVVAGIAWRVDLLWGVGILVLTIPYPRGTVFGNSNVALVLILLILWLLRVSQRQSAPPRRTPLDMPIVALVIAFIVSFQNVPSGGDDLGFALENMQLLLACIFMFYLIVNAVRTDQDLMRFHAFQAVSLLSICLLGVWELTHPGQDFIPGWITFHRTHHEEFLQNVRIGGPFVDFELLAEFAALSLLLVAFLFARATSTTRRVVLGGLFLLDTFILFATVTRGALFSLAAAILYLLWIVRRRLRFVPMVTGVTLVVALFLFMNFYVSEFTRSGNLLARVTETHFVGFVPDSRQSAWRDGWERFLEHPIIGHGPYYSPQTGTRSWFWPHNGYLFIMNLTGLVGLTMFLWMMAKLFAISRPRVDTLRHPSYAASFLIIGHVQLALFLVDQIKIEFMRSGIYQFEVWILFASITAAHLIERDRRQVPAPAPA